MTTELRSVHAGAAAAQVLLHLDPELSLQLAVQETTTPLWFALRLGPTTFAIFDSFTDEAGREAHLNGPIAKALMAKAPELLATAPVIERLDVLGVKLPK